MHSTSPELTNEPFNTSKKVTDTRFKMATCESLSYMLHTPASNTDGPVKSPLAA